MRGSAVSVRTRDTRHNSSYRGRLLSGKVLTNGEDGLIGVKPILLAAGGSMRGRYRLKAATAELRAKSAYGADSTCKLEMHHTRSDMTDRCTT